MTSTREKNIRAIAGFVLLAGIFILFISTIASPAAASTAQPDNPLPSNNCPDVTKTKGGSGTAATAEAAKALAKDNAMTNCLVEAAAVKCTPKKTCTNVGTSEGSSTATNAVLLPSGNYVAGATATCSAICDEII
ncbi:MAG: hypothetical protein AABW68_03040 [archaeon]